MPPSKANAVFVILSSALMLVSAQTPPHIVPSSSISTHTSAYSYQDTSMATLPPSYTEYNFTYPVHKFHEEMYTSYKDTIDVTWVVGAPKHLPILQIECWSRNDSDSYIISSAPDLVTNILNLTDPTVTNAQIALERYKGYKLCQFSLIDGQNHTLTDQNHAISGDFSISDFNHSRGQLWSSDNKAPIVNATKIAESVAAQRGTGGMAVLMASLSTFFLALRPRF